jgi:hypothetical protein
VGNFSRVFAPPPTTTTTMTAITDGSEWPKRARERGEVRVMKVLWSLVYMALVEGLGEQEWRPSHSFMTPSYQPLLTRASADTIIHPTGLHKSP